MNARQRKFVAAYTGNATQAAIEAGYSPKTARAQGSALLTKPDIAAAVKKRLDADEKKTIASREERQALWTSVMRGDTQTVEVVDGAEVVVPVRIEARLKASELLGKSERDFVDRVELEGKVSLEALVLASIKDNE